MNSKFTKIIFLLAVSLATFSNIFAEDALPAAEEIIKIGRRGKEIADYEQTAVKTTDLFLSKAVDLALKTTEPTMEYSYYNPSAFREEDNTITVYLQPRNQEPDVILIGGDFKVSISSDGSRVLNKTKLHNSILKVQLEFKNGQEPAGAFHTHVLSDLPTETDVALVLLNPKLAPHYIAGQKWMSKIDADGKVSVLGKTEEILKNKDSNSSK